MKKLLLFIALMFGFLAFAQNPANNKDGLWTKFVDLDTLTTTQRDALVLNLKRRRVIYNITTDQVEVHNGSTWEALGSSAWGSITGDIETQTDLIDLLNQYSSYQGTQILEVNYYWVSSYTYHVNTVVWLEDGILNTNNFNQDVVLDTADPTDPRVDRVVLNITSDTVYDLTGTPAGEPAPPELAGDELELFFVNVPINGPPNVVNDLVYDENLQEVGGEWDTTVSGSVVTNASTEPSNGTLHTAWTTAATNAYVEYSLASPITATDGFLIFKFKQPSVHNFRFGIRVNDGTFSYPLATIENGIFGADNTITTYQTIVIPFEVDNVQSIRFINTRNNSTLYFDEIYVQTGVEIPVDPLSLYLNNLADVDVTGATDGQGITYDSATQTWVNTTLSVDTDDQTAVEVPITDTGAYYTGTEVETALQEIGASLSGLSAQTLQEVLDTGNTSTTNANFTSNSAITFNTNSNISYQTTSFDIRGRTQLNLITDNGAGNFSLIRGTIDDIRLNTEDGSSIKEVRLFTNLLSAQRNISFPDATGTLALEADPSGFNGNLTTTDNTLQEIAQKFDDFVGGGATNLTTTHNATDVVVNSDTGTDATINLANGTTAGVSENNLTDAEKTKLDGIEALADVTDATNVNAAGAVMESDYNANTILAATSDNTPVTLTVGEQTFVGRVTGGNITALTQTQAHTLLNDRILENATVTTTQTLDYAAYEIFNFTVTGDVTFSESNLPTSGSYGKIIVLNITGDHALTYPAGWSTNITGAYDGTVNNVIVVWYIKSGTYKVQITQPD